MNESHAHNNHDEVMDVDQLSALLRTNKSHLYELSSSGVIPATKVGRQWLYVRSVIMQWLKEESLKQSKTMQTNNVQENDGSNINFSQFQERKNVQR